MTLASNALTSFAAIGNREDLADTIYNVSPTLTPLQGAIGETKATAVNHEWQTDSLASAAANAQLEGDEFTQASQAVTTRAFNKCQISAKMVTVTATQMAVNPAGRTEEMAYQLVKKNKELRRDMEFTLLANAAPVDRANATAGKLRPLPSWYSTNVSMSGLGSPANGSTTTARTDGTARALTEAMLFSVLESQYNASGEPIDIIMSTTKQKKVMSTFTGNGVSGGTAYTKQVQTADAIVYQAVDVYKSDFGDHKFVINRFGRDADVHCLATDMLAVAYLRKPKTFDVGITGDNLKAEIVTEYTLEVRNEAALGLITDLS